MPLLEQARDLTERLKRAEAARTNIEEAHALETIRTELSQRLERIQTSGQRIALLRSNGVPVSASPTVDAARAKVKDVSEKYTVAPTSKTLRQGRRWTSLIETLDSASESIAQRIVDEWKQYFASALFGGAPPDQIRQRLAMTPQNESALARYTDLYRRFIAFRTRSPAAQSEVDEIRSISDQLEAISFTENVPDAVRTFFAATATAEGATLNQLLPEVWEWLRENRLLDTYVVKARLQGAGRGR
jgi:hypothetical protein